MNYAATLICSLLLLFTLVAHAAAHGQTTPSEDWLAVEQAIVREQAFYAVAPLEDFAAFVEEARQSWGVPGVAVAVVKDGEVVFMEGFGVRAEGQPEPVDENTVFELASVSKAFTASTLGALVDEGRLDWDDTVLSHLPGFALSEPYATVNATIRDLLAHRSSLPAFTGDLLGMLGYDRQEVLRQARYLALAGSFREVAGYSNLGYLIAGMVAGEVDGSSWEEVLQSRVFEPLGMERSTVGREPLTLDNNVAANHDRTADGELAILPWVDTDVFAPAGGVNSTARDLAAWMLMLLGEGKFEAVQILQAQTVEEMFRSAMVAEVTFTESAPIDENAGWAFALGWATYHYEGYKIVEKGGALSGVRTVVTLVPQENLGVAVLANLNFTLLPEAVRAYVLEAYLGVSGRDLQGELREQYDTILSIIFAPPPATPDPGPPTRPLEAYMGVYKHDFYGRFSVRQEGEALVVEAGPACYRGDLTHDSYDTFSLRWPGATVLPEPLVFTLDASGRAATFEAEIFNVFSRFERVDESEEDCP